MLFLMVITSIAHRDFLLSKGICIIPKVVILNLKMGKKILIENKFCEFKKIKRAI